VSAHRLRGLGLTFNQIRAGHHLAARAPAQRG
jgi:hypothetical protein